MTTQNTVEVGDYQADLEYDFGNEDQTGYTSAMGQVIDLVPAANGTIVHVELLPGAVEDYQAAIERAKSQQA